MLGLILTLSRSCERLTASQVLAARSLRRLDVAHAPATFWSVRTSLCCIEGMFDWLDDQIANKSE